MKGKSQKAQKAITKLVGRAFPYCWMNKAEFKAEIQKWTAKHGEKDFDGIYAVTNSFTGFCNPTAERAAKREGKW